MNESLFSIYSRYPEKRTMSGISRYLAPRERDDIWAALKRGIQLGLRGCSTHTFSPSDIRGIRHSYCRQNACGCVKSGHQNRWRRWPRSCPAPRTFAWLPHPELVWTCSCGEYRGRREQSPDNKAVSKHYLRRIC